MDDVAADSFRLQACTATQFSVPGMLSALVCVLARARVFARGDRSASRCVCVCVCFPALDDGDQPAVAAAEAAVPTTQLVRARVPVSQRCGTVT